MRSAVFGATLLVLGASWSAARAAQEGEHPPATESSWQVALRVSSTAQEGAVVVDRGARDGLAVGDTIVFSPRSGGEVTGVVREVQEERATVELASPSAVVPLGTRGVARITRARQAAPPRQDPARGRAPGAPAAPTEPSAGATVGAPGAPEQDPLRDGWPSRDEWTSDMPLLAGVGVQRPAERPRELSGRAWATFDSIFSADGGRSDTFFRTGTELVLENPFGAGGTLWFEGEASQRRTQLPDDSNGEDTSDSGFRLDRFAYEIGGTRFEPERWTFGRFLSREMPEFGVQDGVEWSRRLDGGHRFGVSAAFLPEPDEDLDGTSDLGLSGWYRWVRDEREETTLTAGFQKTFHDGDADRDLVVLKAHHLPVDGWTFVGSAWLDLHAADDVDAGLALTEAHLAAGRRFDGAHDLRVVYDHREYPELLREEFPAVGVESIADGALDRLGLSGAAALTGERRLSGRVGAWADEDDGGGDAELGFEARGFLLPGSRLRLAAFLAQGKTSALRGARIGLGRSEERFAWELVYEVQEDTFDGFDDQNDDAVQHRVRATTEVFTRSGWVWSIYGEVQLQDVEDVVLAGFHLGRSF